MSLNSTAIEWTDYTWNPVTGCNKGCWYCYVRRLPNYDFRPGWHPERINDPLNKKKGARIFACSTADLFGDGVDDHWINQVLEIIRLTPQHQYQVLTKCPSRAWFFQDKFPGNLWLGTSVDTWEAGRRILDLQQTRHSKLFLSFEPLLDRMDLPDYCFVDIKWVIMGALTGDPDFIAEAQKRYPEHRKARLHPKLWTLIPPEQFVKQIHVRADRLKIPVFEKDNLLLNNPRREFPAGY